MALITGGTIIEGAIGQSAHPTAPSNGTSAVQTLAISGTPTGGTFTLSFEGATTAPIAYNANAAAVQAALEALRTVEAGDIVASGGALPGAAVVLTFGGNRAALAVETITADGAGLTGGSDPEATVTLTTPGVTATRRGAGVGAIVTDMATGDQYTNTGTATAPSWTLIGTQS